MIRNKSTIQIISRLLMAVFLFVIISPISVYASDSESDNETDEEYESWIDALQDPDYYRNLTEMVTNYWVNTYLNYVDYTEDPDIVSLIGDQYDNTISFADNLYNYILPYSLQTVDSIDPTNLQTSIYGKPIANKNNLKLIQDTTKTLNTNLQNDGINTFQNIANKKNKNNGLIQFDELPDKYYFATKNPIANLSNWNSAWADPAPGAAIQVEKYTDGGWAVSYASTSDGFNISDCIPEQQVYVWWNGTYNGVVNYFLKSDGNGSYSRNNVTVHTYSGRYGYDYGYVGFNGTRGGADYNVIYGSCYINRKNDYDPNRYCYYWNQEDLTLTLVNMGYPPGDLNTNGTPVPSPTINNNIIYSVDIGDFTDLVNQLMLDVNMDNNITNSLLLELLLELQNQRNNYVENDGDDIYDYIDYMMNKLLEVKDVHIEIPDISPDLGGIAEALTALLNFLATIIRTIGSIVETLIQGLLDLLKLLFIPDEASSNDISIQINNISKPIIWIGDFMNNSKTMISILLMGDDSLNNDGSGDGSGEGGSGSGTQEPPVITVDFSNSTSEFDYGGEVAIMDLSWYAPYKSICDPIIVAFCWVMFIVRVVKDIPGIINGFSSNNNEGE